MPSRRSARRSLLLALSLTTCRASEPPLIGDGYARDANLRPFLEAIRPSIEERGVRIERWGVTGELVATVQLNSEQASIFADNPRIVGVVGHAGSRDALLGAAVYNARGLPQVVPNATSRRLGDAGPWTFMLVPDDSVEGEFLASFAVDSLRATRVSVLFVGDEYGIGLRDGVEVALARRGGSTFDATMVPATGCATEVSADVHSAIARAAMRRADPEVVILATGTGAGWCLASIIHGVNPGAWILGADGVVVDAARFAGHQRVVAGRFRAVEYWRPGPDSLSLAFTSLVRQSLGRDPTAAEALQYDAFMVLAEAVREAGPDRQRVRDWLTSLGRSRDPVPGVTGPITFHRPRTGTLRMSVAVPPDRNDP